MFYFLLPLFLVGIAVVLATTIHSENKLAENPFRVAQLGNGDWVVQQWSVVHSSYYDDGTTRNQYDWVTIYTGTDQDDAVLQYKIYLKEKRKATAEQLEKERQEEKKKKEIEESQKVVKVLKIKE